MGWFDNEDNQLGDKISDDARRRAEQERNARRMADAQRDYDGTESQSGVGAPGCPLSLILLLMLTAAALGLADAIRSVLF